MKYLDEFKEVKYLFWSPRIPRGRLLILLQAIERNGLELVTNEGYKQRVEDLRFEARKTTRDIGNPFFRALQIMEHLYK